MTRSEFLKLLGGSVAAMAGGATITRALGQATNSVSTNLPTATSTSTTAVEMAGAHAYEVPPHFVSHGPGLGRRIALTFDDGPNPGITEIVLKELENRGMKATFFMIGQRVAACPALAKTVLEQGHEIGNHSYTHPKLSSLSDEKVRNEIESTQKTIQDATGYTPIWFRPPYGAFRHNQGPIAESMGLGITLWSVDPQDWAQPGVDRIISRVTKQADAGSIVLMHDLHKQTAQAVSTIFDQLIEREFEFTTISGFLGKPYPTS